ncbi:MAG TPA: hypothetical protein VHE35_04770, partial [Kofleriaceae bacterium]|nr:hypothetical protein [Kofleriaceae bacterium]
MVPDWVIVFLLAVSIAAIVLRTWGLPRGPLSQVLRPRSIPVLVLVALVFGAAAVAMVVYGVGAFVEPTKVVEARWLGAVDLHLHQWPLGLIAVVYGTMLLGVPFAAVAKLAVVVRARRVTYVEEDPLAGLPRLGGSLAAGPAAPPSASVARPARDAAAVRRE